jgi:hypothetical protein
VKTAWSEGVQVVEAKKNDFLMATLIAEFEKVIQFVDAKRTILSDDMPFVVTQLLTDFYYLKFEEFLLVFDGIKKGTYGKYYERLKMAEVYDAFRQYEVSDQRITVIEEHNRFMNGGVDPELSAQEMYDMFMETHKIFEDRKKRQKEMERDYIEYKRRYNESKTEE